MATIKVTPEQVRHAQSQLQNLVDRATALTNGYLNRSNEVMGTATWAGGGALASLNTSTEIHSSQQKTFAGWTRLNEGLGKTATVMEHNEADAAHTLNAVFAAPNA